MRQREGSAPHCALCHSSDFSPPWMATVQCQHSPDLHPQPGATFRLFCPKKSGKAEPGNSCSGKRGLEPFPGWAVPCCPAGEQILVWNLKANMGCGMGVGTELWELVCPQPGLCNLKFGRAGPRAAQPRAELVEYLRWGRTELETWNHRRCKQ